MSQTSNQCQTTTTSTCPTEWIPSLKSKNHQCCARTSRKPGKTSFNNANVSTCDSFKHGRTVMDVQYPSLRLVLWWEVATYGTLPVDQLSLAEVEYVYPTSCSVDVCALRYCECRSDVPWVMSASYLSVFGILCSSPRCMCIHKVAGKLWPFGSPLQNSEWAPLFGSE